MTSTTEPGAEPPVPPAATDGARPRRGAARARERGVGRGALVVGAVALVGFGVLAAWLAMQKPTNVTHAEALRIAVAVENAKTLADLERVVAEQRPWARDEGNDTIEPDSTVPTTPARLIQHWKDAAVYTFMHAALDDDGTRSVWFRVHNGPLLFDYHELRLARIGETVKVVDLWSLMLDGWLSKLRREELDPELRQQRDVFLQRLTAKPVKRANPKQSPDPATASPPAEDLLELAADYAKLPAPIRTAHRGGMQLLVELARRGVPITAPQLAEYRAANPGHSGPDVLTLADLAAVGASRDEGYAARERLKERLADQGFLQQAWLRLRN
jgi:hypothetical protein